MGVISLLFVSCAQDDDFNNKDKDNSSIESKYSDFVSDIKEKFDNQVMELGWVKTKSNVEGGLLDIIFQITQEDLQSKMHQYKENGLLKKIELKQDSVFDQFFLSYSGEDFEILNTSLEYYIKEGGHNATLLIDICKNMPANLISGCVYMCAYADVLASKTFWLWLDDMSPNDSFETRGGSAMELNCRYVFWNKLRLISLAAGSEYLVSMVSGPVIPAADTLITVANLCDAGAAAAEYYACCRGGISL